MLLPDIQRGPLDGRERKLWKLKQHHPFVFSSESEDFSIPDRIREIILEGQNIENLHVVLSYLNDHSTSGEKLNPFIINDLHL